MTSVLVQQVERVNIFLSGDQLLIGVLSEYVSRPDLLQSALLRHLKDKIP